MSKLALHIFILLCFAAMLIFTQNIIAGIVALAYNTASHQQESQ